MMTVQLVFVMHVKTRWWNSGSGKECVVQTAVYVLGHLFHQTCYIKYIISSESYILHNLGKISIPPRVPRQHGVP